MNGYLYSYAFVMSDVKTTLKWKHTTTLDIYINNGIVDVYDSLLGSTVYLF